MNPKIDVYLSKAKKWQQEMTELRKIVLETGLTEELKWGHPCYTFQQGNVVLIHSFKNYSALLFFKGALLKDPKKILIQQTENVQAARQIRFTTAEDIVKRKTIIKAYIREAIAMEKTGSKINFKETKKFKMPGEFQAKLKSNAALKKSFASLTPGRQRAYLLYFSSAKQAATRESRIEKYTPQILRGKGLDD